MTINSVTSVLFTWHTLQLSWQQRISDHQSDSFLPTHWKTISLQSKNSTYFYLSLLWKPLGTLRSETAHFCTFCRHLKLARKNSRLISSPASHHGLTKSIISSDFQAVFYSFSFRDDFYLESHSIQRAACFWHDEKKKQWRRRYSIETFVRLQ